MKISTKSWHFRLNQLVNENKAGEILMFGTTLCPYFWLTVRSLLSIGMYLALLVALFIILIAAPVAFYWYPSALGGAGLIIWGVAAVMYLLTVFPKQVAEWLNKKYPGETTIEKKPNILVEYIKAKKAKFCPIVEVVRED